MRNKQINKIDNLIEIKKIFNTTESREKSQDNQNKQLYSFTLESFTTFEAMEFSKKMPVNIESSIALIKKWF